MVVMSSYREPSGEIRHQESNTRAFVNERELGSGTLYIAESILSWKSSTSEDGFSLEYPHISLHAVSKDFSNFPHECLYIMLDADVDNTEAGDDDEEEDNLTIVRFVPADKGILQQLFEALKDCQLLHPDPNDSISEDDFEGEDTLAALNNITIQRISTDNGNGHDHSDDAMDAEPGQFDDAE
ncbi:methylosome subunit pICln isoform X2 [Cloeon dipterum]|uniref:methylosome subunit pICln isoform X2 n=1 Tax=Cloeon dipterum TaxID=197152 RepID=UPI00321F6480